MPRNRRRRRSLRPRLRRHWAGLHQGFDEFGTAGVESVGLHGAFQGPHRGIALLERGWAVHLAIPCAIGAPAFDQQGAAGFSCGADDFEGAVAPLFHFADLGVVRFDAPVS